MKKLLFIVFLLFVTITNAQNTDAKPVTYISFAPCITNEVGPIETKFSPTIEVGRQFQDIFTLGFAVGKTNLKPSRVYGVTSQNDTIVSPSSYYVELRPNLNVFQVGKFTNTITPGIGYVFGPGKSIMLESTMGIEYEYTEKIHFNIFFGSYYYSSLSSDPNNNITHYSPTFFGFSVVKFFRKTNNKALVKIKE
jgi:hypothetical protein